MDAPGSRSWQAALTNPIWIAVNILLRARGIRAGASATTDLLDYAETLFEVDSAVAAASICDEQVAKIVGTGNETQFKFRRRPAEGREPTRSPIIVALRVPCLFCLPSTLRNSV